MARTFAHTALHPLLHFETRCKDDRQLDKSVEIYTHNSEKIMLIQKVRGGGGGMCDFHLVSFRKQKQIRKSVLVPRPS